MLYHIMALAILRVKGFFVTIDVHYFLVLENIRKKGLIKIPIHFKERAEISLELNNSEITFSFQP